jgi:hypothetical protein
MFARRSVSSDHVDQIPEYRKDVNERKKDTKEREMRFCNAQYPGICGWF